MFYAFAHMKAFQYPLYISRFGASILVDSPQSLDAFDRLMFNPRCFVLHNDSIPPSEWTNVSLIYLQFSHIFYKHVCFYIL